MHCVHIRSLRSIPIIICATLPSIQLEMLKWYAVPPASPSPLKVTLQALVRLTCELLFLCRLSFALALDARLLASKSIPCRFPSCFSALLFVLRLMSLACNRTFLLRLPFLPSTPIPLLQPAHPCLPYLRIPYEESFQLICLYYGTDFEFVFLLVLRFAVRCSY